MTSRLETLQDLVDEARRAMEADAAHDLSLGRRDVIQWAMGPFLFAPGNTDSSGYLRRVRLATLAVERVVPVWRRTFPDNSLPEHLLARAREIAAHRRDSDLATAAHEFEDAWATTEKLYAASFSLAATVGFAAARTLSLAISDGFTDSEGPQDVDREQRDSPEFESNDANCIASGVYADGPVEPIACAPAPSTEKRREFWRWWLNEAVFIAWDAAK